MSRLQLFKRHFHTAVTLHKLKPHQRGLPKMLQKMVNKGLKKKWDAPPNAYQSGVGGRITEGSKRRAQALGPMLHNNIKDLIHSGHLDDEIFLSDLEISRVKVTPDLSTAHVYWVATATEADHEMQKTLTNSSVKLRHLIKSYQILEKVPIIVFVKDVSQVKSMQLLELLKKADMGDDYKLTETNDNLRTMPALGDEVKKIKISNITNIGQRFSAGSHTDVTYLGIKQYSNQFSKDVITRPSNFTFHNDLYGVQHDDLMKKLMAVTQKKKKSKMEERTQVDNLQLDNVSEIKPHKGISKHLRILQRKERESPKRQNDNDISNLSNRLSHIHDISLFERGLSDKADDDDSGDEIEQIEKDLDYSDEELDEQHILDEEIDEKYIDEWVSDNEHDDGKSEESSSDDEGSGDKYIDELDSSDEEINDDGELGLSDEEIDELYDDDGLGSSDDEIDEVGLSDDEIDEVGLSDDEIDETYDDELAPSDGEIDEQDDDELGPSDDEIDEQYDDELDLSDDEIDEKDYDDDDDDDLSLSGDEIDEIFDDDDELVPSDEEIDEKYDDELDPFDNEIDEEINKKLVGDVNLFDEEINKSSSFDKGMGNKNNNLPSSDDGYQSGEKNYSDANGGKNDELQDSENKGKVDPDTENTK